MQGKNWVEYRQAVPRLKPNGAYEGKGGLGSKLIKQFEEVLLLQLCRDTPAHSGARRRFQSGLARRLPHNTSEPWQKACLRRFRLLLWAGLTAASAILPASGQQQAAKLKVVATFSILGDFSRNVDGDRAEVTTLVGSNGDVHVYTPTTGDAEVIRNARLVIINGLGLEGWLPRHGSSNRPAAMRPPWSQLVASCRARSLSVRY
jgi:zinc/manganese transport system substrate-binding protein